MKRVLDLTAAITGIVLLSPLFLIIAISIYLADGAPVLFRQVRVGRNCVPFTIYKFRTMRQVRQENAREITTANDSRIFPLGAILRNYKLDELPQLFNIVKGDMGLVGPRPEVPRYVEMYRKEFEEILAMRPGITDPASLCYRNEAEMLAAYKDPEYGYSTVILPHKLELARQYRHQASLLQDMRVILLTIKAVIGAR